MTLEWKQNDVCFYTEVQIRIIITTHPGRDKYILKNYKLELLPTGGDEFEVYLNDEYTNYTFRGAGIAKAKAANVLRSAIANSI